MARPDFIIIGAPKAGTTALHAALATHPELYLSPVKEPKFFLCDGRPPARGAGPGDAHSAREWVWQPERYAALFEGAPEGRLVGESTPFYLYDRAAHDRLAAAVPHAKLIAVLRDPVDRAYSNWMHLWSDGLEPISDFEAACAAEPERIERGWAPFWHYQGLGRYGEQFQHLLERFEREQVYILRYRDLVDFPIEALDEISAFLGVSPGAATPPGAENARPFVRPGVRADALGRLIRAGASVGAHLPPAAWRVASRPLVGALQRGGTARPALDTRVRRNLVSSYTDDNALLSGLAGSSFADWLGERGRGDFATRSEARSDGSDEPERSQVASN
jgi:hypothetical protein